MLYDYSQCECPLCTDPKEKITIVGTFAERIENTGQTLEYINPHAECRPKTPTPWAVNCLEHGLVFLTNHEYNVQLVRPNALWKCPICNEISDWDDDNYEAAFEEAE